MRCRWLALAVVSLTSVWIIRAVAEDAPLPEPVFAKLVENDAAFLKKALARGKVTDKVERKVKAIALMIAAYAQNNMGKSNAAEMATLRDTALKLIKAVEGKQMAEAKTLAAAIAGKIKVDPAAKPAAVPLHTHLKFEFLMRQYSGDVIGGFGLERDLESLVEQKGPLASEQKDKAPALAYKIAVISQLAQAYPSPVNGKDKEWRALGKKSYDAALAFADAVKKGDNVGGAADTLSGSCVKCHDVFKNAGN